MKPKFFIIAVVTFLIGLAQQSSRAEVPSGSDAIAKVLSQRHEKISKETVAALKSADAPPLIEALRSTSKLEDKYSIIYALGQIGGDDSAKALIEVITNNYGGKVLSMDRVGRTSEMGVLLGTLNSLGFVAAGSDIAWEFIKGGTDRKFWDGKVRWDTGGEKPAGLLVGECIKALALSGRPEVPQLLEALRDKESEATKDMTYPNDFRTTDGALVDAAFYVDLRKTEDGMDFLRGFTFSGNNGIERFIKWKKTDAGKAWDSWSQARFRKRAEVMAASAKQTADK